MSSLWKKLKWNLVGILGKMILWVWHKSARVTIVGQDPYLRLREKRKPVILMVWHGRIFILPYFFRNKGVMPLVSPSQDGEIAAQIMARWGHKIVRGSSSHMMVKAWNEMRKGLQNGGEVIVVSDGPRGPNRKMKMGGLKLAQLTRSYLVPFSFSTSRKKFLQSWDQFLMFYPFSRVVTVFGQPVKVQAHLSKAQLEEKRKQLEKELVRLDRKADEFFSDSQTHFPKKDKN
ncbi:lysophospholipid acyltransferase family protein [bacterium]|nr:lysophospholipid acyltransferase family protein [bacterium]